MASPSSTVWMTLQEPLLNPSDWVVALTLFTANLSICSAGFLLLIFQRISRAKNDLIICFIQCLAVVDILFCIGMDMGIAHYANTYRGTTDTLCLVQSFICTFCDMVSYCYVTYIIIHVFSVDVLKSGWMKRKNIKRIYHSIAWVFPATITISAISTGALGDAKSRFGSWCWIQDSLSQTERLLWMLFTKQIWESLIYVLSASLIIITIWLKKRKRRITEQSGNQISSSTNGNTESSLVTSNRTRNTPNFNVMVWVLFYFYFTRIWGTTRNMVRIVGLALGKDEVTEFKPWDEEFFIHAQCIGDSMQGTMNFLMFCYLDDKVWCRVREVINRKILDKICCKNQDDDLSPILHRNNENASYC